MVLRYYIPVFSTKRIEFVQICTKTEVATGTVISLRNKLTESLFTNKATRGLDVNSLKAFSRELPCPPVDLSAI